MDINFVNQNFSGSKLATLKNQKDLNGNNEKDLKDACKGFEAVFLNFMMQSMRKTIPEDKLFGDGNGMDIYTSMSDQYLTENISETHNDIGLKDFLYQQLTRPNERINR